MKRTSSLIIALILIIAILLSACGASGQSTQAPAASSAETASETAADAAEEAAAGAEEAAEEAVAEELAEEEAPAAAENEEPASPFGDEELAELAVGDYFIYYPASWPETGGYVYIEYGEDYTNTVLYTSANAGYLGFTTDDIIETTSTYNNMLNSLRESLPNSELVEDSVVTVNGVKMIYMHFNYSVDGEDATGRYYWFIDGSGHLCNLTFIQTEFAVEDHNAEFDAVLNSIIHKDDRPKDKQISNKDINDAPFVFGGSIANDTEDRYFWGIAMEEFSVPDYALSYYKTYFKSDSETHYIVNMSAGLTYELMIATGKIQIFISQYTEGDEEDFAKIGRGTLVAYYYVDLETGEITRFS